MSRQGYRGKQSLLRIDQEEQVSRWTIGTFSLNILDFIGRRDRRVVAKPYGRVNRSSKDLSQSLVCEKSFIGTLGVERKRAERSRNVFVLMLLHSGRLLSGDHDGKALARVEFAISSSKRETDFSGWYKENSVIGVILTEVGQTNRNSIQTIMSARVKACLRVQLDEGQVDQIHITFHVFPEDWVEKDTGNGANVTFYPDVIQSNPSRRFTRFVKRTIDIAVSLAALICLSPLFFAIALAIKLTSKGPVLFKQERVGQYGIRFVFLKFRSMHFHNDSSVHREFVGRFITANADSARPEQKDRPVYKITADSRVTPLGKFLRKTSFDELPQFWNVVRGQMSLVGPRPPVPYELACYDIWHRRRILEVKPGITGLWQVLGRSRTTFDEMVRLDLRYANTWSLWLDIKILLKTPLVVISGEGAY